MLMFCTLSHPDGTTNEYRSTTWGSGRGGDAQSMWWMECETAGMLTADRVEQYTRPAPCERQKVRSAYCTSSRSTELSRFSSKSALQPTTTIGTPRLQSSAPASSGNKVSYASDFDNTPSGSGSFSASCSAAASGGVSTEVFTAPGSSRNARTRASFFSRRSSSSSAGMMDLICSRITFVHLASAGAIVHGAERSTHITTIEFATFCALSG
mmetsp:Transcript_53092/g.125415  ORF Transcript_53092/g.125415 Transcript_53092/m.125415 type:complete len:211 (-) Transcript_53092:314-946(-)